MTKDQKIKAYHKMVKELLRLKNDVRENVRHRVSETETFKDIQALPENDLPMHLRDYSEDSPAYFILKCRMEKVDPFETDFSKCVEVLYDVSFSMESYRNIGYNDGLASVTSMLLNIAGLSDEASQVLEGTYSFD
jgi:hypothetical protein